MERMLVMVLIQCFLTPAAWALSAKSASNPAMNFFVGKAVEATDEFDVDHANPKMADLASRIVTRIEERYGLNVMNMRAHGVKPNEYLVRMADSDVAVIYIDAANIRRTVVDRVSGHFSFDIVYARGSKFFVESEPEVIRDCRGTIGRDKQIEVQLERCIANHQASL